MNAKHKITIPEPCHENWDKMTPKFMYSQTNYHKIFLLALFLAMGTTLFSCTGKNGDKQKVDKVEIVKDSSDSEAIYVGKAPKNGTQEDVPPPPPPKNDRIKFVNPESEIKSKKTASEASSKKSSEEKKVQESTAKENTVLIQEPIIVQASYPDGVEGFYRFFSKEFKLPEGAENPKAPVTVSFIIEKDGSLSSYDVPDNIDSKVGAEILRVLKHSPKWSPGLQNGKKTRNKYSLPLYF